MRYLILLLLLMPIACASTYVNLAGEAFNASNYTQRYNGTGYTINISVWNASNSALLYSAQSVQTLWNGLYSMDFDMGTISWKLLMYDMLTNVSINTEMLGNANLTYSIRSIYSIGANDTLYFNGQPPSYYSTANSVTNLNYTLAALTANISNYSVYSADLWDALDYPNATQFLTTGNILNLDSLYIASLLATTTFNATTINVVAGTYTGNLSNITRYDSSSLNITGTAGAPGMDFIVNFTGISDFSNIAMRFKSPTNADPVTIYLYNYDTSTWESYYTYYTVTNYFRLDMPVSDPDEHINTSDNNKVRLRILNPNNGNTNHVHSFDWIALQKGVSATSTIEADPLSVHTTAIGNEFFYNMTLELNFTYAKPLIDTYQYIDQDINSTGTPKWVTINATRSAYHNVTRYGAGCIYINSTGAFRIESTCTV